LTIDNLLAVEMVLADGSVVTASEGQHPDLFWAIRGGGGNFGAVTSFTFQLHPLHKVFAGPMFWPAEASSEILERHQNFIMGAPEEINGFFAFLKNHTLSALSCNPASPERLRSYVVLHRQPGPVGGNIESGPALA
jgi:hypothetical protein